MEFKLPVLSMPIVTAEKDTREIQVERTGVFALHPRALRSWESSDGEWTVSHFDSGYAILQTLLSRKEALRLALYLERCLPNLSYQDVRTSKNAQRILTEVRLGFLEEGND